MKPSEILRRTAAECAGVAHLWSTEHALLMVVAKIASANGYDLKDAKVAEYFWSVSQGAVREAVQAIPAALEAAAAKLESEGK